VARWWGPYDLETTLEEIPAASVIQVEGAVGGWILADVDDSPQYRHVGLDIALATRLHGRGLGREAIRLAVRHHAARGHHRFTIDPAADNARAIRAYAAVGFRPVGVLRAYERLTQDGPWRDGLLMDLLAGELVG
jgi:aminoglycoside 6'-N-acetyltransferase